MFLYNIGIRVTVWSCFLFCYLSHIICLPLYLLKTREHQRSLKVEWQNILVIVVIMCCLLHMGNKCNKLGTNWKILEGMSPNSYFYTCLNWDLGMRYNLSKITRWVSDGAREYSSSNSFWCFFLFGMLLMIIFSAAFVSITAVKEIIFLPRWNMNILELYKMSIQ